MIINGIEFAFDSGKLSDLERYEKAYSDLRPKVAKGDENVEQGKLATAAKLYISAFKDFFLDLTGQDIVGDTEDYILCKAYFEDFATQLAEQKQKTHDAYFSRRKGHK